MAPGRLTDVTNVLRIATRKSRLALWQAEHVRSLLVRAHPDLDIELVPFTTTGDRILDRPLAMIGGNSRVNRDVLPFALLVGDSQLKGLNAVGLRRADVSSAARAELREAFRLLRGASTFEAVLDQLDDELQSEEGRELVAFLRADSRRGYCGF